MELLPETMLFFVFKRWHLIIIVRQFMIIYMGVSCHSCDIVLGKNLLTGLHVLVFSSVRRTSQFVF